jgi:hypothetical protein
MEAGIDFLGDTDVKINSSEEKKKVWKRFIEILGIIIESLKPFKKDVQNIRSNYDRSITLFFEILQQMFVFQVLVTIIYSYLIIAHFVQYKDEVKYYSDKLCGYGFPCLFFYSRY